MEKSNGRLLNVATINQHVRRMPYSILGPLYRRSLELEKEIQHGAPKKFKDLIRVEIGDAQALGQQPITFFRQLLSLVVNPNLFDCCGYPADVKTRAAELLKACNGSTGCYTDTLGLAYVRNHVASFIESRDGYPADPADIILTNGASEAIKVYLKLLPAEVNGLKTGIMIPVPQYPIYSATITEYDMRSVFYYLDENNDFAVNVAELERSLNESRKYCHPKAIVIINPGNPSGQVLSLENIRDIIQFAYKERLLILADEVYQENVYNPTYPFHSFKKVMCQMGEPYSSMQLASFHSCSKGYLSECGVRGGYAEFTNLEAAVKEEIRKLLLTRLCPSVAGQIGVEVMVNPPTQGPSFEIFQKEKEQVLQSFSTKARILVEGLNSIPGIKCNPVHGSLYVFAQIHLPERAIEAAKFSGQEPDMFYAMHLLEETGICSVPGSAFGQIPGTYHVRFTILPSRDEILKALERLTTFHLQFLETFTSGEE